MEFDRIVFEQLPRLRAVTSRRFLATDAHRVGFGRARAAQQAAPVAIYGRWTPPSLGAVHVLAASRPASLPFAMGKNQKKKGQTLSLAEFTSDTVAQDPLALPTAPRETT